MAADRREAAPGRGEVECTEDGTSEVLSDSRSGNKSDEELVSIIVAGLDPTVHK